VTENGLRVVGIGGGHGLATTLKAARMYASDVSAVVTVADDGGSSGRLTRELGIPPPGDIRNCLVALAGNQELARLYQHRFQTGALTGHTVGNLVIAALTEMEGDFGEAVARAGRLLECRGRVYPATTEPLELYAEVHGGRVKGQVAVAQTEASIKAVFIEPPDPPAYEPAVEAIAAADQIVLGPGSLFTSLIATLVVPGIRRALVATSAHRVLICNTRRQKGETEELDAAAHVGALLAHIGPSCVDAILVQVPEVPEDGVKVDESALAFYGVEVVRADMATPEATHDPQRLAEVLKKLSQ
jgi:uncharacterized cofD-like protein